MKKKVANKRDVLTAITFGHRIAEDEADTLIAYFVEPEQWRTVISGGADVVYGPKGSGKSAIYSAYRHVGFLAVDVSGKLTVTTFIRPYFDTTLMTQPHRWEFLAAVVRQTRLVSQTFFTERTNLTS